MFDDEKQLEVTNKEGKLRELLSTLSENTSDIGDWKIVKSMKQDCRD